MIKINTVFLDSLLDSYIRKIFRWTNINKVRVFLFIVSALLWLAVSRMPYFNLIFTKELVVFLVLASLFLIFKINWKIILYFCFGLFLIAWLFDLAGLLQLSELLGNYIYGYLVLIVIRFIASIK